MDITLLAFLSGAFGVLCIGREVKVIIRERRIRISNLFLIMYGVTYGIVLSLLLIFYRMGIFKTDGIFVRFDYSNEGLSASAWWLLAAMIGYVSFRFGGLLRIRQTNNRSISSIRVKKDALALDRLQTTSILCLAIGIVCFIIWTEGWGGYRNLFLNAAAIRNSSYGIRNRVAFFAKPAQIVATVSIMSIYLIKQKKSILLNGGLFAVSFCLSLLYYLAKDGRMVMAMYLLIVLFMASDMFERQRAIGKKFLRLGFIFVLFVIIVLNMDSITLFLRFGETATDESSALESVMSELSFIYVAGQTSIKHCMTEGSPMLILHDVGSAMFAWVPSALTPKGLVNIWDYNTELISGGRAVAQYPSDFISTSLYDLGIWGPVLIPIIWGAVISMLERVNDKTKSPIVTVVYYSLSMALVRAVDYSMLSSIVASAFHLFVAVVVYWGICHVKIRS